MRILYLHRDADAGNDSNNVGGRQGKCRRYWGGWVARLNAAEAVTAGIYKGDTHYVSRIKRIRSLKWYKSDGCY